jgi:hypothetical protein
MESQASGVHDGRYDDALEHLQAYGPECFNGFVNHAPMAIEALAVLGLGDQIAPFVAAYEPRVPRAAPVGQPLSADEQPSALGNASLYPRWQATFRDLLAGQPMRDVLATWLPILAPGCFASAFHGVLMAAHALRALEDRVNAVRTAELVRGLAYWAATYQPLPGTPRHAADGAPLASLIAAVPVGSGPSGGAIDAGVDRATRGNAAFAELVSRPRAIEPDPVATVASAGARALLCHPDAPIIFVHAVTGPVAFRTLARWLDEPALQRAIDCLWQAVAGMFLTFTRTPLAEAAASGPLPDRDRLVDAMLATRDEHAIKVVEAALREHAISGDDLVLHAAEFACHRIRALQ